MSSTAPLRLPNPVTGPTFLAALKARRGRIAAFVLGVGALMGVISLFLTPWYTGEAKLMPPSESSDLLSNLTGLVEASALNRIGLITTATPSDLVVEIMKSRRLREALIQKFDLMKAYRRKTMDATLKELELHLSVKAASSGIVVIRAEAPSKTQAADMANFMVSELDRFNREVLNTRGKRMRLFLEEQLVDAQRRMVEANSKLTAYERKHGVLVSADESSARGMADIVSQRIALQVRRAYIASYSSPESPEVRSIDAQLEAFDRQLGGLPEVKNEGQRLALDATIQRKVFALFSAQYEQARVDEMRDIPTVTVLDVARPPDLKSRPKRSIMVVIAMAVAFLGSAGWVRWSLRASGRTA